MLEELEYEKNDLEEKNEKLTMERLKDGRMEEFQLEKQENY